METNQNKALPPGSPTVNLTLQSPRGGQRIDQPQIDTSRSISGERREIWADAIALPARLPDILLQALTITSAAAFACSASRFIPSRWELLPLAAVALIVTIACVVVVWQKYPDLRLFVIYWASLIVSGGCMGVLL